MPSRSLSVLLACTVASAGCGYSTIQSRTEYRDGEPVWLGTSESFHVRSMSLAGDTLALSLGRECVEGRTIERETVDVETRERDVGFGFWAGLSVASSLGLITALMLGVAVDPGDDPFDSSDNTSYGGTLAAVTAGATGVAALGAAIADGQTYETEMLRDRRWVSDHVVVACPNGWPQGQATLLAGGRTYPGRVRGEGEVSIDLEDAPPSLWAAQEPLQLSLSGVDAPLGFVLSDGVRQAALERPDVAEQLGPTRAYVWAEDDADDLLASGVVRVQNVLTGTGRYVFAADAYTRERIARFVEVGGGSAEARLRSALEAANAENIKEVMQLSAHQVGSHVQLVLAVYQTSTADRVFLTDRAIDGSDGLRVLETFDALARAFLAWRGVDH